jgi:hypothetical protein
MAGNPQAQIPYNYFAGAVPSGAVECSHEAGYLQVVTDVVLSTAVGYGFAFIELHDPSGNGRLRLEVNGTADPPIQIAQWHGEFVVGPSAGMEVVGDGETGLVSIDGYLLAPLGSGVW